MTLRTVDDALAVLEALAETGDPQSLGRICDRLGFSRPHGHRLLASLKARHYVTQDPDTRLYAFGPACAQMVGQARRSADLILGCSDALHMVWEVTGETAYLAVLDGDQAIVVNRLEGRKPVVATSSLGRVMPLHAVSAGKVLLASLEDPQIERLLEKGLPTFTAKTPQNPEEIWASIRRIRLQGYAINRDGWRDGASGVAAPVRWGKEGRTAAALAVCVPDVRFRSLAGELTARVLEAAGVASNRLAAFEPASPHRVRVRTGEEREA